MGKAQDPTAFLRIPLLIHPGHQKCTLYVAKLSDADLFNLPSQCTSRLWNISGWMFSYLLHQKSIDLQFKSPSCCFLPVRKEHFQYPGLGYIFWLSTFPVISAVGNVSSNSMFSLFLIDLLHTVPLRLPN